MSQNSSRNDTDQTSGDNPHPVKHHFLIAALLPLWVFVSFLIAQQITIGLVWLLKSLSVPLTNLNESVFTTIVAVFIYAVTIALVVGLPWLLRKRQTSLEDLGLQRLPFWRDILMAPVGLIVYFILSAALILTITALIPSFDVNQAQDTGFNAITQQYQLILAFVTLVVLAPLAEEVLFRGYLFGKLRRLVPIWVAILITSALFGLIHGAWNLAIDTFALSIVLCLLRVTTGSLWAPMLLHMTKNGIAFYLLFIHPLITSTING